MAWKPEYFQTINSLNGQAGESLVWIHPYLRKSDNRFFDEKISRSPRPTGNRGTGRIDPTYLNKWLSDRNPLYPQHARTSIFSEIAEDSNSHLLLFSIVLITRGRTPYYGK